MSTDTTSRSGMRTYRPCCIRWRMTGSLFCRCRT